MSKLIKQMSYKILPGRQDKIQDICDKFQAIIDRNNKMRSLSKSSSFKEEYDFYSIIIPGLSQKIKKFEGLSDIAQKVGLSNLIQVWIEENGKVCKKYLAAFDKENLTNKNYAFKNLVDSDTGSESESDDFSFKSKENMLMTDPNTTIIRGNPIVRDISGTATIVKGGASKSKAKKSKKLTKKAVKAKPKTVTKKPKVKKVGAKTKSKK